MNILQKINEVRKSLKGVSKDATVSLGRGSYKGTTHDNVISKLQPFLIEHGIVFWVSDIEQNVDIHRFKDQHGRDKQKVLISAKVQVTYANTEDTSDCIVTFGIGMGEDSGDKASGKALSYAVKYCHLKTFALITGIDDEERMPEQAPQQVWAPPVQQQPQRPVTAPVPNYQPQQTYPAQQPQQQPQQQGAWANYNAGVTK